MDQQRAVFYLSDAACQSDDKPLMLEAVLFCPLLTWVSEELAANGGKRFFVVCGEESVETAKNCFPSGTEVTASPDPEALREFLSGDGPVTVFPGPVLPIGGTEESGVFTASAAELREKGPLGLTAARPEMGYTAVHSFAELQSLSLRCRDWILRKHMESGVAVLDPSAVYVDPRVTIGAGTTLLPGTILRGRTVIGRNCEIGPHTMIRDCTVGDDTLVNASQTNESTIGSRTKVGPFAYVRPGSVIGDDIKVGDFVEVKNSVIGNGTKISHLTYVGDTDVGEQVNFGCGTVTTNYDGFHKYRTVIGNGVFIGCNTNLVAPVSVGDGAYIAAGATITKDVPADSLAIARSPETIKDGWAARRREMHGKK